MSPSSEFPRNSQTDPEETVNREVAGMFDAFVSLEEIAPGLDWLEVLADSWGIPIEVNQAAPKVLEP